MSLPDFRQQYEWNPITLVGGIVGNNLHGGTLDIVYLLQPSSFPNGILSAGNVDPDDVFAHFSPVIGGQLIKNEISEFPLANQIVAANAIIVQPLQISLIMHCPAKKPGDYLSKKATMTNLQSQLAQHTLSGGRFNVSTPSFIYTNCLLISLTDVSDESSKQVQTAWQWDFEQPLLTVNQAQQAQNNLVSKMTGQTQILKDPITGGVSWTDPQNTVNQPQSLATPSFVPSSTGSSSSAVAGLQGQM